MTDLIKEPLSKDLREVRSEALWHLEKNVTGRSSPEQAESLQRLGALRSHTSQWALRSHFHGLPSHLALSNVYHISGSWDSNAGSQRKHGSWWHQANKQSRPGRDIRLQVWSEYCQDKTAQEAMSSQSVRPRGALIWASLPGKMLYSETWDMESGVLYVFLSSCVLKI